MNIIAATVADYPRLQAIWESAVSATHDFLAAEDFAYYRSHLPEYFGQVALYACADGRGELVGFVGVAGGCVEMLFVDNARRGQGVGWQLLAFAVGRLGARRLDVNAQNRQAIEFYARAGFSLAGRSPLDGDGRPYPLLHLRYEADGSAGALPDAVIRRVRTDKKRYLDLLLLGDEQEEMIDRYLERGEMFVLEEDGVKAVCVVTDEGDGICELKNIAVVPAAWRRGYGRRLVRFLIVHSAGRYRRLTVGTGDVPSTVGFYRRCGFVYSHRVANFFTDNYDHPIVENGVQLRDMVYLSYDLEAGDAS